MTSVSVGWLLPIFVLSNPKTQTQTTLHPIEELFCPTPVKVEFVSIELPEVTTVLSKN